VLVGVCGKSVTFVVVSVITVVLDAVSGEEVDVEAEVEVVGGDELEREGLLEQEARRHPTNRKTQTAPPLASLSGIGTA
jgi:hypothetical protein